MVQNFVLMDLLFELLLTRHVILTVQLLFCQLVVDLLVRDFHLDPSPLLLLFELLSSLIDLKRLLVVLLLDLLLELAQLILLLGLLMDPVLHLELLEFPAVASG